MISRRLPRRRRLRRLVKRTALQTLHAFTHHYLSLVSAAVLAMAAIFALTSTSFEIEGQTPSAAAVVPASSAVATATPGVIVPTPAPVPDVPSVVYYFIDSQETLNGMNAALHRDLVDEALVNYKPLHNVRRIFIMVEDHRDEAEALELIRQQATTPVDGVIVRLVDLR